MAFNYKYRLLNKSDLEQTAQKRHILRNCKGHIFAFNNNRQIIIIAENKTAQELKKRLEKRSATITAEILKNDKCFLLLNCANVKSIKALAKSKSIKHPNKQSLLLGIDNLIIKQPQKSKRLQAK